MERSGSPSPTLEDVKAFLSHLATHRKLIASTQSRAFSAQLFRPANPALQAEPIGAVGQRRSALLAAIPLAGVHAGPEAVYNCA